MVWMLSGSEALLELCQTRVVSNASGAKREWCQTRVSRQCGAGNAVWPIVTCRDGVARSPAIRREITS
jgi:hypothetical protein